MRTTIQRFMAALLLVIPGIVAAYGFLAMKDAFFHQFEPGDHFRWGKFILGFILFGAGTSFVGGWIFFRDRKRGYLAPRFKGKRRKR